MEEQQVTKKSIKPVRKHYSSIKEAAVEAVNHMLLPGIFSLTFNLISPVNGETPILGETAYYTINYSI